jgi:ribosomal protein S27AE
MKVAHAVKSMKLNDGTSLHFWYANNKGNSGVNCTIIRTTDPRASMSRNQTGVIGMVSTGHWKGIVNFNKLVEQALGVRPNESCSKCGVFVDHNDIHDGDAWSCGTCSRVYCADHSNHVESNWSEGTSYCSACRPENF